MHAFRELLDHPDAFLKRQSEAVKRTEMFLIGGSFQAQGDALNVFGELALLGYAGMWCLFRCANDSPYLSSHPTVSPSAS